MMLLELLRIEEETAAPVWLFFHEYGLEDPLAGSEEEMWL